MSKVFFAVTDGVGKILRNGYCSLNDLTGQAQANQYVRQCSEGVSYETHYHDGSGFVPLQEFNLAYLSLSVAVNAVFRVNNIPAGTVVTHPGGVLTVDDGFIEWSCMYPGNYEFRFSKYRYKEEIIIATVTSP